MKAAEPEQPWLDSKLNPDRRTALVLEQLTLDEKIAVVHGVDITGKNAPADSLGGAGYAVALPRLGLGCVQSDDGRSGASHAAFQGRYATALPAPIAYAASWDVAVAEAYGTVLGQETRALGFQISLGGTANIVREPRSGRVYECLGEDPILAGVLLGRELRATQAQGVVANLNRFALNDQETGRLGYNVVIDRRSMRETDLLAFEIALRDSDVGSVMGAYNRVNGTYACENDYLLNQVLKRDWGFKGWVMSDWWATQSTVGSAMAGLDQEMPTGKYFSTDLKAAVESGAVPRDRIDDMVRRILRTEFACGVFDGPRKFSTVNPFVNADVALRVAEQGSVLLRNAGGLLPLSATAAQSVLVVGSHADVGVLSGAGSDQVDPVGGNAVPGSPVIWQPSSPLRALRAVAPAAAISFDPGSDPMAAAAQAAKCDVVIVFASQHMKENADVPNLSLPDGQDELIARIAAANPHTVVVLETGGPILMPWLDRVGAVLAAWYPGIRGGEAIANIIFGRTNPSGKLALTFPRSESDLAHPVVLAAPPGSDRRTKFDLIYDEKLLVGYKWFDARNLPPLLPFGFGLSYTTFTYENLRVNSDSALQVRCTVSNTGKRAGAEIVQIYLAMPASAEEPPRRLVAWKKVDLRPGERREVECQIDPLFTACFDSSGERWKHEPGTYTVYAGGSSRDLPLQAEFSMKGDAAK